MMPRRASTDQPVRSPALAVLKGLCPRCRQGRIFRGAMAMRTTCPVCDLKFAREPGYFLAAMYFSYALGILVLSIATVVLWLLLPQWRLQWLVLLAILPAALFVPWIFRFSRVLWIHFDRHFKLAGKELSPAFKAMLAAADTNKDKALGEDEIAKRFESYVENNVGRSSAGGVLSLNGEPLAGVRVAFIPDPILADVIQPAQGTTDDRGNVSVSIDGADPPGVQPGIYRIEISKKDASGKELLPARYNSSSDRGLEVAMDAPPGALNLDLRTP